MLIVVGGTLAVTIMSYSIAEVTRAQQAMLKALVHRPTDPAGAAETALNLAEVARDRGPMYLPHRIGELKRVPFRPEEARVGKGGGKTCRYRGWRDHYKK